jgi:Tfp pilus assembly protein PilN
MAWKAELNLTQEQRDKLQFWMLMAITISVTVIALSVLTALFQDWLL